MDFLSFCDWVAKKNTLPDTRFSFVGVSEEIATDYRELCKSMFQQHKIDIGTIIHIEADEFENTFSTLSMTFLGNKNTYWLYGLDKLSASAQKKWLETLFSLESPHTIFLIHNNKKLQYGTHISVKDVFTKNEAALLSSLLTKKESSYFNPFFNSLLDKGVKIAPAALQLLIAYSQVVGTQSKEFLNEWIPHIFVSEQSLFQLSQSFFARDTKSFLNLFRSLSLSYSMPFWCSWFSEHIFKAALFIYTQKNKSEAIFDIEYRLPFSFLKKDWKMHTFRQLISFHQSIIRFDRALKMGEIEEGQFELLCITYMEERH